MIARGPAPGGGPGGDSARRDRGAGARMLRQSLWRGLPRGAALDAAATAHECGRSMRGPMLILAAACVAIGLAPALFWPAIARAIEVWSPAWTGSAHRRHSLRSAGPMEGLRWSGRWRMVALATGAPPPPAPALTWDCGYATPTARMQLRRDRLRAPSPNGSPVSCGRSARRSAPKGTFPTAHAPRQHTPETVLERVVEPAGGLIMRGSLVARRLQHGRAQSYVLYLLVGLAVLAAWVFLGGG